MKIPQSKLLQIIRETFSGYADERPNNPMERAYARAEEEEDVGELARYHALNGDKDVMLYRDNPDYKEAYDEILLGEAKMKITKRQLKRIIKEEKQKLNEEERMSGLYGVYQRDPAGSGKPRAAWEEHHATIVDEIAELMSFYPDMVDHGGEAEVREYWEAAIRQALQRGI